MRGSEAKEVELETNEPDDLVTSDDEQGEGALGQGMPGGKKRRRGRKRKAKLVSSEGVEKWTVGVEEDRQWL